MGKKLIISINYSEAMQIIESLDNERGRWAEIVGKTNDEDISLDYENDIIDIDELILRFKKEAQNVFGENIVELAHCPRGICLSDFLKRKNEQGFTSDK
jgi:hypothetical protein